MLGRVLRTTEQVPPSADELDVAVAAGEGERPLPPARRGIPAARTPAAIRGRFARPTPTVQRPVRQDAELGGHAPAMALGADTPRAPEQPRQERAHERTAASNHSQQ